MSQEVFHYAPLLYLPRILRSGYLQPSNAGATKERPLLWFSTRQDWEPTATKAIWHPKEGFKQLTFAQQAETFGCIRFALPAEDKRLMHWADACKMAGIPAESQAALELLGRRRGADPAHWLAVHEAVMLSEVEIDIWQETHWERTKGRSVPVP